MIATKTLPLLVMGLEGRENGRKAKNCQVVARVLEFQLCKLKHLRMLKF